MAPKFSKQHNESSVEFQSKDWKIWTLEFVDFAIFITATGSKTEIDPDGRKTEVFSVEGYNCRGFKYIIQVWGAEATNFEEFFKYDLISFCVLISFMVCFNFTCRRNNDRNGRIFKFPSPNDFALSDVCFRLKTANPFQKRFFEADFCLNLQVADGEKVNYKKPTKMHKDCLPVVLEELDEDDVFMMEIKTGHDDETTRERMASPNMWHYQQNNASTFPAELLKSPVKKRSFDDLCKSPVKVEPGSSSASSASARSPLFNSPTKK
jgi:hypothetical protein